MSSHEADRPKPVKTGHPFPQAVSAVEVLIFHHTACNVYVDLTMMMMMMMMMRML